MRGDVIVVRLNCFDVVDGIVVLDSRKSIDEVIANDFNIIIGVSNRVHDFFLNQVYRIRKKNTIRV
jgi:hypothetical protein